MSRLGFVLLLSLLLAACDRFPGAPPNESGILKYDWVPADPRPAPAPLYCYATLAAPECYATPIPGRILLGNFGAAPPPSPYANANEAPVPSRKTGPEIATPPQTAPLAPVELVPLQPPSPQQPPGPLQAT